MVELLSEVSKMTRKDIVSNAIPPALQGLDAAASLLGSRGMSEEYVRRRLLLTQGLCSPYVALLYSTIPIR